MSYIIYGYDKDNDVYEALTAYNEINEAIKRLSEITTMHVFHESRCLSTKEPFDWFIVCPDSNITDDIAIGFTSAHPNGTLEAKIMITKEKYDKWKSQT